MRSSGNVSCLIDKRGKDCNCTDKPMITLYSGLSSHGLSHALAGRASPALLKSISDKREKLTKAGVASMSWRHHKTEAASIVTIRVFEGEVGKKPTQVICRFQSQQVSCSFDETRVSLSDTHISEVDGNARPLREFSPGLRQPRLAPVGHRGA